MEYTLNVGVDIFLFSLLRNDYTTDVMHSWPVSNCAIDKIEHVTLRVAMYTDNRGGVGIFLTSPAGFKSKMMRFRHLDNSTGEYYWDYGSVQFWDERSTGTWSLELADNNSTSKLS